MLQCTKMARKKYTCMFPWGACLGPMEWMRTNSTISPSWLGHKHCESRFLNLCKTKTHEEIMKLGMVSLNGTYNCQIWAKLYTLPLIAFKFFSRVNIEQQECCVNFWDFSGFTWTFLYINWVFYAFMCIIQIWTTCTHDLMHINWLKIKFVSLGACLGPMQEMGMNFKHRGTVDCRQNIKIHGF